MALRLKLALTAPLLRLTDLWAKLKPSSQPLIAGLSTNVDRSRHVLRLILLLQSRTPGSQPVAGSAWHSPHPPSRGRRLPTGSATATEPSGRASLSSRARDLGFSTSVPYWRTYVVRGLSRAPPLASPSSPKPWLIRHASRRRADLAARDAEGWPHGDDTSGGDVLDGGLGDVEHIVTSRTNWAEHSPNCAKTPCGKYQCPKPE